MSFRETTYPLIIEHAAPFLAEIQGILAAGVTAGEVRADRPAGELSLLFLGMLALLYVQHWGSRGAWPSLDDIPDLVATAFLDGAAPRSDRAAP